MFNELKTQQSLHNFFEKIRLVNNDHATGKDKAAKIEQILAYLEVMHAQIKKYSKKRELVFIDSGAGNCYLSFLIYYFYAKVDHRPIRIHCVDINQRLMEKNRQLAKELNFHHMSFHASDIMKYSHIGRPDAVYSLHACDTATDKALYLGYKTNAKHIFSVSCCQHSIKKQMRGGPYTGLTRHRIFKDKLVYMMGDSLRALLLQMQGYDVDMIEFVSSRYTDKNSMLRAQKGQTHNLNKLQEEYSNLKSAFRVAPPLEHYISQHEISLAT